MKTCRECEKELHGDESAIFRKLVNKLATDFLCIPCLAAYFSCKEADIHALIKHLRESGTCSLFRGSLGKRAGV